MRFHLFIFILLFTWYANAQTEKEREIDSLEKILSKKIHDTTRVNTLSELARTYGGVDSVKCFQNGFKALELSEKIGYKKGIIASNIAIGSGYMDYFVLDKAEEHLVNGIEKVEKLIVKDSSNQHMALWAKGNYFLGLNYGYGGDYAKEFEYTVKVIPVVEQLKDSVFLGRIQTNLGVQRMNLGENSTAYKYFMQSGKIHRKLKNYDFLVFDRLSFSTALFKLDSLSMMKNVLDDAKVYLDKGFDSRDWHMYNANMGLYYSAMGNYDMAIAFLDKAKADLIENNMDTQLNLLFQRYSAVYEQQGDFKSAISNMTEYLNISKEKENGPGVFRGYYMRSQYQASDENFRLAYSDLLTALTVYDSINLLDVGNQINALTIKYEAAEKEKEILALKVKNEEKKSQSYLLGGIASILSLLLFGGYYVYSRRMRKARKKEHEQEAEVQLLKQEQQNKIFSAMIEGQEKERKRLAIDLHDGLGGRLSGISMNLSKLDKDEPKEYPKQQLQKVMKDLNDSLTELRSVARNMMPETLVKFGLQAALKDYCSSMTGSETKVTLQFYGTDKGINLNQQVTMYRVVQELINNAVKHAKASEVLVQYIREGNQVDITVEDNGVGFDKNKSLKQKDSGMGLSNLQTRVAYLKGNIDFESEENEGTTVNVHINIDAA